MITSVFGISIKYEAWNQQDSLPVYIAGSYNFRTALATVNIIACKANSIYRLLHHYTA